MAAKEIGQHTDQVPRRLVLFGPRYSPRHAALLQVRTAADQSRSLQVNIHQVNSRLNTGDGCLECNWSSKSTGVRFSATVPIVVEGNQNGDTDCLELRGDWLSVHHAWSSWWRRCPANVRQQPGQ